MSPENIEEVYKVPVEVKSYNNRSIVIPLT